jgi:hypothetical protein
MKKDEVVQRRERVVATLNEALAKLGHGPLTDDGKLYHTEIDGENSWAQRLSRRGQWPHLPEGAGTLALPGLRYEVWYFQKRKEIWIGLLCSRREAAQALSDALKPQWREWQTSGKYAKRYVPLDAVWQRQYPDTDGIWRTAPLDDKMEKALEQLVRDTLPAIDKAMAVADPQGALAEGFAKAGAERDLMAELAAKLNQRL